MRVLGLTFGASHQIGAVGSIGVIAGCLIWQLVAAQAGAGPSPASGSPAAMPINPTGRLGELLIAPPSFGPGALISVTQVSGGPTMSDPGAVRLRGLAAGYGGRRALVARGEAPAKWISAGACDGDVCVVAIRRASADLTIAGQPTTIELFRQRDARAADVQPVANAAPIGTQPSSVQQGPPLIVDPVPVGGSSGPTLAGGPNGASQPQPPQK